MTEPVALFDATFVLDAEAVSALVRRTPRLQTVLAAALARRSHIVVPAVVLAEVMTGAPSDAAYWQALKRLAVVDTTARIAARAGALREAALAARRQKRDLTVDAIVAATAAEHTPAIVVTGDPADLKLLAGPGVKIVSV
ncbi:MAG: type II toxin-antitoxin system VapC family toxin [Propionibacteriaceae bacterium]|jgi:predicted nucleic acid-binding protein|nr:type II toxin-antitoxin system VapC family toxin [Propionibacteriaceae bacterium]